jgi:hypothetical protein
MRPRSRWRWHCCRDSQGRSRRMAWTSYSRPPRSGRARLRSQRLLRLRPTLPCPSQRRCLSQPRLSLRRTTRRHRPPCPGSRIVFRPHSLRSSGPRSRKPNLPRHLGRAWRQLPASHSPVHYRHPRSRPRTRLRRCPRHGSCQRPPAHPLALRRDLSRARQPRVRPSLKRLRPPSLRRRTRFRSGRPPPLPLRRRPRRASARAGGVRSRLGYRRTARTRRTPAGAGRRA